MRFLSDIVEHSYSPSEMRRCIRVEDIWEYNLDKKTLEATAKDISNEFFSGHCAVKNLDVAPLRNNRIFYPSSIYDEICLRRTNQLLKNALRTPTLNRDEEIRQLLHVLASEPKCNILRTDIRSFFESAPFAELISKLEADGFRNNSALRHLSNLNAHLVSIYKFRGLPRGLAVSSTLSDYALVEFDQAIFNLDSVVYYTRYVDDICIVHSSPSAQFKALVEKKIPYGLQLNGDKTQLLNIPSGDHLEFLGYRISLNKPQQITIAPGKISRAKERIIFSLQRFVAHKDFSLLLNRLRFLSCSIRMTKVGRRMPVYSGFRHVYRFTPEFDAAALRAMRMRLSWAIGRGLT